MYLIQAASNLDNVPIKDKRHKRKIARVKKHWMERIQKTYHDRCKETREWEERLRCLGSLQQDPEPSLTQKEIFEGYKTHQRNKKENHQKPKRERETDRGRRTEQDISVPYVEVARVRTDPEKKISEGCKTPAKKTLFHEEPVKERHKAGRKNKDDFEPRCRQPHCCWKQDKRTKEEREQQESYRGRLTSSKARDWQRKRRKCGAPMIQHIHEVWMENDLAYELMLEVTTEHRPCHGCSQTGMKSEVFRELLEERSLMEILKQQIKPKEQPKKTKTSANLVMAGATLMIGGGTMDMATGAIDDSISNQFWDPEEEKWSEGTIGHEWVEVEMNVDAESHKKTGIPDPTGEAQIRPVKKFKFVVDTGTQATAIGVKQAEELGVNMSKITPVDAVIKSITGEEIRPLGCFFANITGKYRTRQGKYASVITKDIVYIFEKSPHIYLSRAALIALGVVKRTNKIGDNLPGNIVECAGATTMAEEMTCNETRDVDGNRACQCPEREPVPDPPKWKGEFNPRNVEGMKTQLLNHYASSSFNICKLQPQPRMSDLPPVTLKVNEEKYKPRKFTQASNVPVHLQAAEKAGLDADIMAGVIRKVGMEETNHGLSRQVVVAKPTKPGDPIRIRRTVDFKWLNAHIDPAAYHCHPPP